jgi:hypothetical protein
MPSFKGRSAKQWARFAMKIGLFITDAKLWSAINDQLHERAEDISESVRGGYKETSSRFDNAQAALRGQTHWFSPTLGFLGGIGIGVGLGMLLAPVSGEQARSVIRGKATDVKNKVTDFAAGTSAGTQFRSTQPTGTTGD